MSSKAPRRRSRIQYAKRKAIEILAQRGGPLRKRSELIELVNSLGVEIHRKTLSAKTCAILVCEGDLGAIVLNEGHSFQSQRFAAAHALGHFVLHAKPGETYVDKVVSRAERKLTMADPDNIEANIFASELLMPEILFLETFDALYAEGLFEEAIVRELSEKFDVSGMAIASRLFELGLLNPTFFVW